MLRLRTNAGPAVARNAGLGAATTPLVAFVDTDVRLVPGWLDPLLLHFADDRVGLVAPARRQRARRRRRWPPTSRATHRSTSGPNRAASRPGTRLSYVPAAAIVVRTDALRAIDGFERTLRLGEDVDAVWRLVEAGWRCRYEPASVVHHRPRGSWRALVAQRISLRLVGGRRWPSATPARSPRSGSAGGAARRGRLLAAGQPLARRRRRRRHGGGPRAASCRACRPPSRCASPALGHLHAGRLLADAGRRAWWPLLLAGALGVPAGTPRRRC